MIVGFIWLLLADLDYFPKLMFAYIFPYHFVIRGFGDTFVFPVIVIQAGVILSYICPFFVSGRINTLTNVAASIFAILWFAGVSIVILLANFH
mgnify:CR=1 FL=1